MIASFTVGQVAVIAVAIFLSALVTAVAGFGFALMSVPLMSLVIDLHSAVIVSSIVGTVGTGVQSIQFRRERNRMLANRLCLASIIGLPFGYAVYATVSDAALRIALGVAVVIAVVALLRGLNLSHIGPSMDWVFGFFSGVLNTSISTSGPPLVFDLQARHLAPMPFRATIQHVFFISGMVGLLIFWVGGKIDRDELITGLIGIPALFGGLAAGLPLRHHISPERFRILVIVLLLAGAAATVSKAFT
jgi:uncharacterized protein